MKNAAKVDALVESVDIYLGRNRAFQETPAVHDPDQNLLTVMNEKISLLAHHYEQILQMQELIANKLAILQPKPSTQDPVSYVSIEAEYRDQMLALIQQDWTHVQRRLITMEESARNIYRNTEQSQHMPRQAADALQDLIQSWEQLYTTMIGHLECLHAMAH